MRLLFILITMMATITGCSDYNLTKHIDETESGISEPEIEVTPEEHDFGNLNADGETGNLIIRISNEGSDTLSLDAAYLDDGNENFTMTSLQVGSLEPDDSTELIVTYDPGTYESNNDVVSIWSNDSDEPEVQIPIGGAGDAPVIRVTPESYDFGDVYVGCDDTLGILIENAGNVNLEITDLEYFASLPVDFSIEDFESSEGPLPWTLSTSDWVHLRIEYTPMDDLDDGAWLEITSNDPVSPIKTSEHEGIGDYESWVVDSFEQDGDAMVDILFVIDNSGSMNSNQTNLKNNFDDFMAVFVSAGVDYQIALITTDDATFVGDIITPASTDPTTEFEDQVDSIGCSGGTYEKGLWFSYESTSSGGDAAPGSSTGFFREPAKFVVVYVSDEPDISSSTYGSGGDPSLDPSDYSAHLLSLKSSSDFVAAHAVAGDYPSGCTANGGAAFGDGYYDVVNDLGGTFMSICADDWSTTMDTLARDSMAMVSFVLTETPIEDTISVTVDGYVSTDWSYDSSTNTANFTTAPSDGSAIEINYAILSDCESDTADTGGR
jgi:hypothetical protein